MKRTILALAAAATVALGTIATPRPASALAEWVIPVIIAAGVGGVVVGAAASSRSNVGEIYVSPTNCRVVRERTPEGIRRVQVCN
jgi:hypothetical protein